MKHFCTGICLIFFFIFFTAEVKGQVIVTNRTNTTPNLAATYTSLANAVTALNGITAISGPVIITLSAGNNQTAPSGGYEIKFTATTSAANNITFNGSSNTITAFSPQAAGTFTDAIFKIIGADYVTIQNFIIRENPANITSALATNNMTEWGVALLYLTTGNGAQNNTIRNNIISLNKSYRNTFGIYSNTRHSATAISTEVPIINNTTAPNKGNKIYGNNISNVNMGITFLGSGDAGFMDTDNDIGGTSAATGNTITNWGGSGAASNYISNTTTSYCIYINHQKDENVSFNTITSASISGTTVDLRGIFKDYSNTLPVGTFVSDINSNTISITNNFTTIQSFECIRSEGITATLSTATININNNLLLNNIVGGAATSISLVGISNVSLAGLLNINGNIFRGNTSTASTGGFTGISNSGSGTVPMTVNINNNKLGDASGDAINFSVATSSSSFFGIRHSSTATAVSLSISNNNFQGFVLSATSSGSISYVSYNHAPTTAVTNNINSNTFTGLQANTTGSVALIRRSGVMALNAGATENCNNNTIVTGFSVPVAGGIVSMYSGGATSGAGNFMNFSGNNFSNVSLAGATIADGCYNNAGTTGGGPTKTITNNVFDNWSVGTSITGLITGTQGGDNSVISGTQSVIFPVQQPLSPEFPFKAAQLIAWSCSNNLISSITLTGTTGSVVGIYAGGTAVTEFQVDHNIIQGFSTSASGFIAGMRFLSVNILNVFSNKIHNISGSSSISPVIGVEVTGGATGTFNICNNLVGDLRSVNSSDVNGVIGFNLLSAAATASYNIYYNSIYLQAVSGEPILVVPG